MPDFRATVIRVLQGRIFSQIVSTSLIMGYQYYHHKTTSASLEAISLELRRFKEELKEVSKKMEKITKRIEKNTKMIEKITKRIENVNIITEHRLILCEEHIEKHGKVFKEVARTIERQAGMNGVWDTRMTKPMREVQTDHPVLVALETAGHCWGGFRRENRTSLLVDREVKV